MEKHKVQRSNANQHNSGEQNKLKYEQSTYLKHRKNARNEYRWGGVYYSFNAYERKNVDDKVLENKDFKKSSKYFTIEKGAK